MNDVAGFVCISLTVDGIGKRDQAAAGSNLWSTVAISSVSGQAQGGGEAHDGAPDP